MVRCTSYCWNNFAFQSIGSLSFLCFEATESQNTMLNTTQEMQEIFFPLKVAASVAKRQFFVNWVWVCHGMSRVSGQGTLEWQQRSAGRCGGRELGVFVPWHDSNSTLEFHSSIA